jgi:APA family basic amino acid/polyamine antiporter
VALRRVLGGVDAAWLVAGNMVGAGIFVTPGIVAGHLPGAAWSLAAWLLGGLLALAGAAVYGELGARLPHAGGDYRYLSAAFGPRWGFLSGWAAFTLTFSASAAALAIAAAEHFRKALPALERLPAAATTVTAAALILALTAANAAGARVASRVTAALTGTAVAGLFLLFGLGLAARSTAVLWPQESLAAPADPWPLALGAAMIPIFFTYSGWNAAAYVAGEIDEAPRNLPRALLAGTGLVTLLYLAINAALLATVPAAALAGSATAGSEAARRLLGPGAELVLSGLIAVAILGSANVTLMAGARIYYAMAADSLAPARLACVSRAGVPGAALWAGGVWSALLAATGTFSRLVSWATLAMLLLSSLTVAGVFVMRARRPGGLPYRCPGYPLTPLAYLAASLAIVAACAISDPWSALVGLLIVASGLIVYIPLRSSRSRTDASPSAR